MHSMPMHRNLRIGSMVLLALVVLATAGCRMRRTIRVSTAAPAPEPVVETTEMPAPMPVAMDEGGGGLLGEVSMRTAVEQDKARFAVEQRLEQAREHIRNGEYADAETLLLQAQELDAGNREVRMELRDVQAALGRRPATAGSFTYEIRRRNAVREDEQRTTASKYVNLGRMHLQNRRFDSAIENFEQALFIIESSPYAIDWKGLKDDANAGLREARRQKDQTEEADRRQAVETSLAEMAREEEQRLILEQQRLERILGSAIEAFDREEFGLAETYAQQVLDVQPDNTKARELLLASGRARHGQVERDYLTKEKRAFQEWMDDIMATRVPQQRVLKWPSQSFWDRISAARKKTRPSFGDVSVDPEAEALKKRVRGTTVNLAVDNQTFKEVVKQLQIQTGINVVIDPRIESDVAENPVNGLFVEDLSLETVLNLLQGSAGDEAVWMAKGNVVLFTNRSLVKKNLVVQIHTVADLTSGLTNFIPPTITLVSPDSVSDEENPLFGAEGEEPVLPYGTVDELIELIKGAVEPRFWEETEGADIKGSGEHSLVVKATPEVQEKVNGFLTDLRGFAGIVVTVETRFLEVGDFFLRDVGVDFRGLGGQTPGQLVNLDDVTNGLEDNASSAYDNGGAGLATGAALNPSAGVYFNDGQDGDFRGRTENIFNRSLGSVLSSLGGASLTLSYLDDTQFSMIVRAVEKSAKARTLTAPTITVYNTQRANLTVVNQLSYIQDFDVEVAQTSFIADPIVGIIQDGLTLDVRPTVSNDRRYITLEIQPTVADLVEPIPTFATTLAASFAPVIIQLPELRLQQARVTVRIPDKGSILIGGLKNITTVDRQSQTPLFADIPILSFLFSRKGRSDEISHLMILVRAEITDLHEQEENLMGGNGGKGAFDR
jgi:general secretion pathway protein D